MTPAHFQLGEYTALTAKRLQQMDAAQVVTRLWQKDPTVWIHDEAQAKTTTELTNRLGWLSIVDKMRAVVSELHSFAQQVKDRGITQVVLLGMGGSSLAAEVLANCVGSVDGFPTVQVLDSTSPAYIAALQSELDLENTLFLVASKSGTTVETMSLFEHFYALYEDPGTHFVTLTDPGSKLERMSRERGLYRNFATTPEVGGRFSALSLFGLVPAALMGLDLERLLACAQQMIKQCQTNVAIDSNPGVKLGAAIGELALDGRNKLTFVAPGKLASFATWAEQLIAESTGKEGVGVVPVAEGSLAEDSFIGDRRAFIALVHPDDDANDVARLRARIEASEQPFVWITLDDTYELAGEFFKFEIATAVVGSIFGINPFDQPDVELSKKKTKSIMTAGQTTDKIGRCNYEASTFHIVGQPLNESISDWQDYLGCFFSNSKSSGYIALMAYLPPSVDVQQILEQLRVNLSRVCELPTTLGFGPRFLHSTGQLHKGDSGEGLFVQLTQEHSVSDRQQKVPGRDFSFAELIAAQADGDFLALVEKKRQVVRLHLKSSAVENLQVLAEQLPQAIRGE